MTDIKERWKEEPTHCSQAITFGAQVKYCSHRATYEFEGKPYCGRHHPFAVEERRKWQQQSAEIRRQYREERRRAENLKVLTAKQAANELLGLNENLPIRVETFSFAGDLITRGTVEAVRSGTLDVTLTAVRHPSIWDERELVEKKTEEHRWMGEPVGCVAQVARKNKLANCDQDAAYEFEGMQYCEAHFRKAFPPMLEWEESKSREEQAERDEAHDKIARLQAEDEAREREVERLPGAMNHIEKDTTFNVRSVEPGSEYYTVPEVIDYRYEAPGCWFITATCDKAQFHKTDWDFRLFLTATGPRVEIVASRSYGRERARGPWTRANRMLFQFDRDTKSHLISAAMYVLCRCTEVGYLDERLQRGQGDGPIN
jgi:hypothetical protein